MERTMERAGNFLPRVDKAEGINEVDRRVVSLTAPASAAAEQYRTLYYRLERMRELRPMKVVAITSSVPGEGKTVTAVNVALTAARANREKRVLLIDADLRRSQVADVLGIRGKPGLTEVLEGDAPIQEAIRRFNSTSLMVLPAGGTAEEPTQVLASDRMKTLLKRLRETFDEVYIDLPPTLPFADAAIVGMQTDGVVMVIRAGQTSQRLVNNALESLQGAPVVGCVLNGGELAQAPYVKNYLKK